MTKESIQSYLSVLATDDNLPNHFKDFLSKLFGFEELRQAGTDALLTLDSHLTLSAFNFEKAIIYFTTTDSQSHLQKAQSGHTNLAFSLIPTTSHHKTELVCATKAINKAISSYNILFFLSKDYLSIAFATRRLSQLTKQKVDVVDKITLIKDISLRTPHPAHIDNLHSLTRFPMEHTLDEYYQRLLEALSIETLNDKFFREIRERFLDFCDCLILPQEAQDKESVKLKREFVLRLLSRLLFCQFLEKKGLVSPKLWDTTLSENYYHEVCEPLFFGTLNTQADKRDYALLPQNIATLLDSIPYLNGGLFAPHASDYYNFINPLAYINTLQIPNPCFEKLFKTFGSYHFTLSESTPLSQEVGLDPELLGMVFENLLSVLFTDNAKDDKDLRKATGSYYTPREIVSYMCASCLCESLKNRTNVAESKLERLVFEKDALGIEYAEAEEILACLDRLKVLDPACGSGAFPLGMLSELLEIQNALSEHSVCELFLGSDSDASLWKRKLKILQNNIFGVDIQPMATEIARLRCFLSLICDAPNHDIQPLPNLEFKFISANSLIPLPKQEELGYVGYEKDMLELKALRERTFDTQNKQELESAYLKLRDKIAKNMQSTWHTHKGDFSSNPLLSWNPFNPHSVAEFFDSEWMFGIKAVKNANGGGALNDESSQGWDIVLGNPPYLQIPKGKVSSEIFPFSEGKDKGKQNLYKVFVEHGYNLATQNAGVFCLITQSSIMCDLSSSHTRELLLTQTAIQYIIEFPKNAPTKEGQVFKTTLQGTCILLCTKQTPLESHTFKLSINNDKTTMRKLCFESVKQDSIIVFYPHRFEIPLIKKGEMPLIAKVKHDKVLLGSILEGTLQGNINTTKLKQIQSHSPTNVLIIKGENCHRYYQDSQVMYGIKDNGFILKALKNNKDKNIITTQNITGTTDTFRIYANFVESKNTKFVFLDSVNISYSRNSSEAKFIVGLLNSQLLDWLFRKTSTNNHVNKYELEDLPIPKITASNQHIADSIIALSDEILKAKAKDSSIDTSHLEAQIDCLVYTLYGLSQEEIHIIQGGER